MKSRYAARVDDNHAEIRETFRVLGYSVYDTATAGRGFPDLIIGKDGVNYLAEVKDGDKPPSQQKLTKAQKEFHGSWQGQVTIIRSIQDAIDFDRSVSNEQYI
jgi:hypothetical protein